MIKLTPVERAALRAEAHGLNPVVMIGEAGLTEAVLKEISSSLDAHGLIKVRVFGDDREERVAIYERICAELDAAPVQHIGKLIVLWRPVPPKEKIDREDRMPGPKVVKVLKFSKSGNHRAQVKKITVPGNMRLTVGGTLKRARRRPVSIKKST